MPIAPALWFPVRTNDPLRDPEAVRKPSRDPTSSFEPGGATHQPKNFDNVARDHSHDRSRLRVLSTLPSRTAAWMRCANLSFIRISCASVYGMAAS
jgi:hypothetical protein